MIEEEKEEEIVTPEPTPDIPRKEPEVVVSEQIEVLGEIKQSRNIKVKTRPFLSLSTE